MRQTTRQTGQLGFSVPEVMIILVVILALAVTGWWAWRNNSAGDPAAKTKTPNQATINTAQGDKFLVIKEWGVRFVLPDSLLGDISYLMNDKAYRDFGGPIRVDLLSGKLNCQAVSIYYEELGMNDVSAYSPQPFKVLAGKGYTFSVTACEEAINRAGSTTDRQLIADLKAAIIETLSLDSGN